MSAGTAYSKRYGGGFVDLPTKTTPIDQLFLNAVEAALLQLIGAAPTADGQVAQWDNANTRFGPALILNKNIDPAAAIAKSKLDFTGANGIVDADIAGAAAIARSKLNFGSGLVNSDLAAAAAIAISKLAGYPTDIKRFLRGDGTWGRIITGRYTSAGAAYSTIAGTGFSGTRLGAGNCKITWTTAFSAAPLVMATADDNTGASVTALTANNSATDLQIVRCVSNTGTATDGVVSFIAFDIA